MKTVMKIRGLVHEQTRHGEASELGVEALKLCEKYEKLLSILMESPFIPGLIKDRLCD